jgi:DNA (cytosine-5)-methyltransferase 1
MKDCKSWNGIRNQLPKYSQEGNGRVPYRTAEAIKFSREIYARHKKFINSWKKSLEHLPTSWTKFEWQGYRDNADIWKHIIQFRASGIRIIKPDCAPSLVAMSSTQTPILGPQKRYMSIREAAALQSLDELLYFPETESGAYKALGNAVNALIVRKIAEKLIH